MQNKTKAGEAVRFIFNCPMRLHIANYAKESRAAAECNFVFVFICQRCQRLRRSLESLHCEKIRVSY